MRTLMLLVITHSILNGALQNTDRKKRSLRVPEGSIFVSTVQLLKAIQIKEPSPINLALELELQWKIPHDSKSLVKRPARLRRRHRRDLYANFELALDSQKLPGKTCVLKSICEAKFILNAEGLSFVEDVLRVILSYPGDPDVELDEYDAAFGCNEKCDVTYPCPFSLLSLLLSYNLY